MALPTPEQFLLNRWAGGLGNRWWNRRRARRFLGFWTAARFWIVVYGPRDQVLMRNHVLCSPRVDCAPGKGIRYGYFDWGYRREGLAQGNLQGIYNEIYVPKSNNNYPKEIASPPWVGELMDGFLDCRSCDIDDGCFLGAYLYLWVKGSESSIRIDIC